MAQTRGSRGRDAASSTSNSARAASQPAAAASSTSSPRTNATSTASSTLSASDIPSPAESATVVPAPRTNDMPSDFEDDDIAVAVASKTRDARTLHDRCPSVDDVLTIIQPIMLMGMTSGNRNIPQINPTMFPVKKGNDQSSIERQRVMTKNNRIYVPYVTTATTSMECGAASRSPNAFPPYYHYNHLPCAIECWDANDGHILLSWWDDDVLHGEVGGPEGCWDRCRMRARLAICRMR